jgi:hypothetical protein
MESEVRMATPRQLGLIEKLRSEGGRQMEESVESLTFVEASELISKLLNKEGSLPNGTGSREGTGGMPGLPRRNDFGAGARLGMAFKCVYRNWVTERHNIFRHKEAFTKDVLETYALVNEIAERALERAA